MRKWLRHDLLLLILFLGLTNAAEYNESFSYFEDQTLFLRHSIRSHFGSSSDMRFPYDKIVLVTVDEYFFKGYGKSPLRRMDLARIITNLNRLGAGVICVDLLMDLPDAYGEDLILAGALRKNNILLASQSLFDADNRFLRISYPTPILKENAVTGYVNISSPSSLGTFLSRLKIHPEITRIEDGWPIAVQVVSKYLGVSPSLNNQTLKIGDIHVQLDKNNDMFIDFSTIPKGCRYIHELAGISAYEYLDLSGLPKDELRELRDWVDGKIVIVGVTASTSNEWFDTPVGMIFGVEIIADTVNTLLKGAPLRPVPLFAEFIVSLLVLGSTVLITSGVSQLRRQVMLAGGLFFGFIFITFFLYAYQGLVFSITYTFVFGIVLYLILSFFSYFKEKRLLIEARREKDKAERERQAAEAANRAKGAFLANISHEIRNPMNAILGFAELLKNQVDDKKHRQYLSAIHSSGKALLSLLKDTLDLSKIEAGKLELEYAPFSLRLMLKDIFLIFSKELEPKGIPFILEIDPGLPETVVLDETRLRQVLLNLISNAVKFTDIGYVKLKISVADGDAENKIHLTISVEDTGIGIDPDQQQRIFEAFEQQKGQRYARYGGTGLGLAICRHLVEMMQGEISLVSTLEAGSLFQVVLNDVQVETSRKISEKEISSRTGRVSFEPATILIVEDKPLNRELMKNFLAAYPFHLLEAENGRKGVEKAQAHAPDLILMDIKMPVMDGCDAAKHIKNSSGFKDIPIIAVTASLIGYEKKIKRHSLFDNYLIKPVSREELVETMMQHLPHRTEAVPDAPLPSLSDASSDGRPASGSQLCALLEQEMQNGWRKFSDIIYIDRIETFGEQMIQLGQEYAYPPLENWGKRLQAHSGQVDVPALQNTLQEFPRLIDTLKKITF